MEFSILINGGESLEKKFKKAVQENQNLHMDLIRSFGHTIMMALRLSEEDKISIDGFRAGEVSEAPPNPVV